MEEPSGRELVEWTWRDFPGRTPGTRAAHTVGIGVSGTFTPSRVIADYSCAPQFNSGTIPVLGRFSNGSGLDEERDLHTDARGMAVKFFRGDEREADMVAMTLPLFFVKDGASFDEFSYASVPVPVRKVRVSWLRKVLLMLQLKLPPQPPPDDVEVILDPSNLTKYAKQHPEAKSAVAALAGLIRPTSYGRAAYHGVHAFELTDRDGNSTFVRYRWQPFLGVRAVTAKQAETLPNDYLHHDMRRRLADGTISFVLELLVAEEGDDTGDPTTPWPVQRRRIVGGVLTFDAVVADQERDQVNVSYNPTRCVHGFTPAPDDQLIKARGRAYEYSCGQRNGAGCPVLH